jgi:hypothetical protein
VLPFFKRQTKQVRDLIPELYLHGLASGDFEMALRGLLGEGAPLSATSLQRLKEKWESATGLSYTRPRRVLVQRILPLAWSPPIS